MAFIDVSKDEQESRRATRDPNLDHPAVQLYREIVRLTPNWFQRKEIVTTFDWAKEELSDPKRALEMWKYTLEQFMREGCNPKRADWAMDRFEQRIRGPKW